MLPGDEGGEDPDGGLPSAAALSAMVKPGTNGPPSDRGLAVERAPVTVA